MNDKEIESQLKELINSYGISYGQRPKGEIKVSGTYGAKPQTQSLTAKMFKNGLDARDVEFINSVDRLLSQYESIPKDKRTVSQEEIDKLITTSSIENVSDTLVDKRGNVWQYDPTYKGKDPSVLPYSRMTENGKVYASESLKDELGTGEYVPAVNSPGTEKFYKDLSMGLVPPKVSDPRVTQIIANEMPEKPIGNTDTFRNIDSNQTPGILDWLNVEGTLEGMGLTKDQIDTMKKIWQTNIQLPSHRKDISPEDAERNKELKLKGILEIGDPGVKNPKSIITESNEGYQDGGVVVGKGGARDDKVNAELPVGAYVIQTLDVPEQIINELVDGLGLDKPANLDSGEEPVKVSNTELIIMPEDVEKANMILAEFDLTIDDIVKTSPEEVEEKMTEESEQSIPQEQTQQVTAEEMQPPMEGTQQMAMQEQGTPQDDMSRMLGVFLQQKREQTAKCGGKVQKYMGGGKVQKYAESGVVKETEPEEEKKQTMTFSDWQQKFYSPLEALYGQGQEPTTSPEQKKNMRNLAAVEGIGNLVNQLVSIGYANKGIATNPQMQNKYLGQYLSQPAEDSKAKNLWNQTRFKDMQERIRTYLDYVGTLDKNEQAKAMKNLEAELQGGLADKRFGLDMQKIEQQHKNAMELARMKGRQALENQLIINEKQAGQKTPFFTLNSPDMKVSVNADKGTLFRIWDNILQDKSIVENKDPKRPISEQIATATGEVDMNKMMALVQKYWQRYYKVDENGRLVPNAPIIE